MTLHQRFFFAHTWVYVTVQLANVLSTEGLFYACIIPFVAFFGSFAFVLYPLRDVIHPTGVFNALRSFVTSFWFHGDGKSWDTVTVPLSTYVKDLELFSLKNWGCKQIAPDCCVFSWPSMTTQFSSAAYCEKLVAQFGAKAAAPIAILRNWSFCLFYVMAELWGSVVVSLLFWGFANQVKSPRSCNDSHTAFLQYL